MFYWPFCTKSNLRVFLFLIDSNRLVRHIILSCNVCTANISLHYHVFWSSCIIISVYRRKGEHMLSLPFSFFFFFYMNLLILSFNLCNSSSLFLFPLTGASVLHSSQHHFADFGSLFSPIQSTSAEGSHCCLNRTSCEPVNQISQDQIWHTVFHQVMQLDRDDLASQ